MSVINYYKRLFVMNYNIGFQFVLICANLGPHQAISTKKSDKNLAHKVLTTFCVIGQYYLGFGVQITSYDRKTISQIVMINNNSQYSYSCQKSYISVWIISDICYYYPFFFFEKWSSLVLSPLKLQQLQLCNQLQAIHEIL